MWDTLLPRPHPDTLLTNNSNNSTNYWHSDVKFLFNIINVNENGGDNNDYFEDGDFTSRLMIMVLSRLTIMMTKTIMTTMTMTMMTTTQRWPGWWQLQRLQQTRREPQRLPWFLPPTWLLTFTILHHHDHHHHSRDHHHHLYGDGNSWIIFCNGNYYNSCCSPRQVTLPSTLIDNYLIILIMEYDGASGWWWMWVTFPTTWS